MRLDVTPAALPAERPYRLHWTAIGIVTASAVAIKPVQ
jgi:hypothetical protein